MVTQPPERSERASRSSAQGRADGLARARAASPTGGSSWKRTWHFWLRWLHVYISMFSLLVMLFFGVTGVTLNHPTWGVGEPSVESVQGTLPTRVDGAIETELLTISEYMRETHGVSGQVTDFSAPVEGGPGTISYRGPGSSAELFFDPSAGTYDLTVTREGFIAMMNELHQGRDSGTAWSWVIDVSGVALVVIALTGLGIQFFLRKRRSQALSLAALGAVITVLAIWVATLGGVL